MRDDSVDANSKFKTHNVLGVIRMERRNACLMAVIDEAENGDASALASATANSEALKFACGRDHEKIMGKSSQWAPQALARPAESSK